MLPEKPNVPYYVEIRPHDTILERMSEDLQPYVRDGSISLGDARQAFLDIGLKATIVESKDFMKMLKENATDMTKVEDFFNSCNRSRRRPSQDEGIREGPNQRKGGSAHEARRSGRMEGRVHARERLPR